MEELRFVTLDEVPPPPTAFPSRPFSLLDCITPFRSYRRAILVQEFSYERSFRRISTESPPESLSVTIVLTLRSPMHGV